MNNTEKTIIGFSIAAFLTSVAYAIFGKRIHSKFTENKDRKEVKISKTLNAEGGINIIVPITNKAFYKDADKTGIKNKLSNIYNKYKSIIDVVSKINKVPVNLIKSVIFIESAGNENALNGAAVGLMQVEYTSATDIITRERKAGKLTEQEKLLLKKYLGDAIYKKVMVAQMGDSFITKSQMLNPELNILIGTMYLGQVLDKEKNRLDRMIARYNLGFYTKKIPQTGTVEDVLASAELRQVTKDYILKLGGKNGTLDLLS